MTYWIPTAPVLLLLTLAIGACSGLDRVPVKLQESHGLDVARYRANAEAFETENELEAALLYRKVIRSLDPGGPEVEPEIDRLRSEIRRRSADHFRKGLDALNRGRVGQARRELLEAIRIDTQNTAAVELLKSLENDRSATHVVKPGETFRNIAEQYYRDRRMALLVARFNDMDPGTTPIPGALVRIPRVDAPPSPPAAKRAPAAKPPADMPPVETPPVDTPAFEAQLADTRRLFDEGRYAMAAQSAERLMGVDPSSNEAAQLFNASMFQQARGLREQERYPEAVAMLKAMTLEWPGARDEMRELRAIMTELAEEHYRTGVKFFVEEELELAIAEWEKAIALNPDHGKAASSIAEAKTLLEALRKNQPVPPRP